MHAFEISDSAAQNITKKIGCSDAKKHLFLNMKLLQIIKRIEHHDKKVLLRN